MGRTLRARLTAAATLVGALAVLTGCSSPLKLAPATNQNAAYQPDVQAARGIATQLQQAQNADTGATP